MGTTYGSKLCPMDDNRTVKVTSVGKTYLFEPLTEGQISAIVLAQNLGSVKLVSTAGKVLQRRGGEDQWIEILDRMATEEMTAKDFSQLLSDAINGGTQEPESAAAPSAE